MSSDEAVTRCRRARERAGLSVNQAAKLMPDELRAIEHPDRQLVERAEDLAFVYGVTVDWLTGHAPLYDYDAIRAMRGAFELSAYDLDELAEFVASIKSRP